jgi:hypothetical protein
MTTIAEEARASMMCCVLVLLDVMLVCCLYSCVEGGSKGIILGISLIYVKWGSVLSYPTYLLSILILSSFSLTLCHALCPCTLAHSTII